MEGNIAEIRMFAGNFAPRNWAFCNGQIMAISQNTALFSLLGTTYGGNGQTTFALPDFRGRVAVGTGQGPGLSNRSLGEVAGTETVTLLTTEIPAHSHTATINVNSGPGTLSNPSGNYLAGGQDATANPIPTYAASSTPSTALNPASVTGGNTGGSQPHNNMPPYLGMNYIICLFGIFPSRN
jgi:microcystin-dependent protein